MSLLNSNGGRTSAPDKTLKETILNEEIQNLREIHRQSIEAFDKVALTLKKIINYKTEHIDKPVTEVETKNCFLQNLSSLQESFLSLIDDFQSDQELFKCTAIFRPTDKKFENSVFRKSMKSYEQLKENLNRQIHRLERDIQLLQSSGYHIYTNVTKPHNIMNSLKKANLDKYLAGTANIEKILQLLKKNYGSQKIPTSSSSFGQKPHSLQSDEYAKMLKNIYWKQHARNVMLVEEIEKSKIAFAKQSHKKKVAQEAMKKRLAQNNRMKTLLKLYDEQQEIPKGELIAYLQTMKEKVDEKYVLTPNLFKMSRGRSKSCHTVYTRDKVRQEDVDSRQMSEYTHILASDFLQESVMV